MAINHKWTDSEGNSRLSEVCASFNRGELHWVTVWDECASEFRTLQAGPKVLEGLEAYESLSDIEKTMVFQAALDESGDMSSKHRAFSMIEGWDLDYMKMIAADDDEDIEQI